METKEMLSIGQAVAAELGKEWTGAYECLYGWKHVARLSGPEGAMLTLAFEGDRVRVSGEYPSLYSSLSPRVKSITLALARGPHVIARDIQSRLLEQYLSSYAKAVERVEAGKRFEAARRAAMEKLALIVGEKPHENGALYFYIHWSDVPEAELRNLYGHLDLFSEAAGSLKLDGVPTALLTRLLKVIEEWKHAKGLEAH